MDDEGLMRKEMHAAIEAYERRGEGIMGRVVSAAQMYALASIAESLAKIAEAVEAQKDANVNREPRAYYGVIK